MSETEATTVLLVDDDTAFVESNRELLEACGYGVLTAHSGEAGLALAKRQRPDLMILDVMMATETEGFEVARRIPSSPELRNMAVVLLTGVAKAAALPRALKPDATWLPVDRVLEKPIDPSRLIREIQRVLQQRGKAPPCAGVLGPN